MSGKILFITGLAFVSITLLMSCGPACTGEAIAPLLLSPADKATITSTSTTLNRLSRRLLPARILC